jgi:predicted alpha/beta-hydrolase family hydrolase
MPDCTITRFEKPDVQGFLHLPETITDGGMVLTHGAGGNCDSPLLIALAGAVCSAGKAVLRCDLPFRQRKPKGPPSPSSAATDRAGLQSAVLALRESVHGPIILGGQSYGGRQASLLAAENPEIATQLLLLSYPLHPPGRPQQLRAQHFPSLNIPVIFVQGTADPFGSIPELEMAVISLPGRHKIISIEKAGHDLKRGNFDLAPILDAFR